jgi:hypothetical protein
MRTHQTPNKKLSFKLPEEMLRDLQAAAKFHDLRLAQVMRKSLSEWLALYYPEAADPSVSVIEPNQVHRYVK